MTLEQALERIAAVDGEWIKQYPEVCEFLIAGTLRVGESKSGELIEVMPGYGRDATWDIFGAICERIESRGWDWLSGPYGKGTYKHTIISADFDGPLGRTGENACHAAALAYLEAVASIDTE